MVSGRTVAGWLPTLGVVAALVGVPTALLSSQTRDWSPDDRAILGDFTRVTAVAVSRDRVYAATPSSLAELDPTTHRWRGPWQSPDPTALQDVALAFADPLDGGVWLVRRAGWLRFDPGIRLWEQGTVPGAVQEAALDQSAPGGGLFLRTTAGWYIAQRGGLALPGRAPARPTHAATVADAVRSNPAIQANSAALIPNFRLHTVRYTAAARSQGFTGMGWYLGTSGAGLLYVPDGAPIPQPILFGLPSGAVDAVYAGPAGVWVVTERTASSDPALSYVAADFGNFQWFQGPRATGLPFVQARRVLGRDSDLWLATDAGVVRITPQSNDYVRYDAGRGLPDQLILDIAQRRGRIVAATAHGLASFSDSGGFRQVAPRFTDPAYAVELSGDTIWVGTRLGLFVSIPGDSDLVQPPALEESVAMQTKVVDLAWRADTLVALLTDRLLWRDPRTGRYALGPLLGNALGRLHTVVSGRSALYVAGDQGIGAAVLNSPILRPFTAPGDLPGQVTDLAVDDTYLWVATLNGLVRFRLDAIGP